jgi:hypothetical protein
MQNMRILVVTSLANPLGTNWVYGFKGLGYHVAVLDWRQSPSTQSQLENWGFKNDVAIFNIWNEVDENLRRTIVDSLGGEPNILFGWWGSPVLKRVSTVHQSFPGAKAVICVDTLPNAANILTELREIWRYRQADSLIDGYVFYSEAMRKLFEKTVPSSCGKPYLAMIEPFLQPAFADGIKNPLTVAPLERLDDRPHVVFTGRGDKLWSKDIRWSKDALGPFLGQLCDRGVHVFIPQEAEKKGLPNLHHYPYFSNADLLEGRFAQYISQFDAHLAIYNDYNGTVRRRVSTGLSTRLAFAMTATSPVAVTESSQFMTEYWGDTPFGFMFRGVDDLVESLEDKGHLAWLRQNMKQVHQSFAFESQATRVTRLMQEILAKL